MTSGWYVAGSGSLGAGVIIGVGGRKCMNICGKEIGSEQEDEYGPKRRGDATRPV